MTDKKTIKNKILKADSSAVIPLKWVGPIKIESEFCNEEISVPLATFELPLWPSVDRGARISRQTVGIKVVIEEDQMTRSFVLEANSASEAIAAKENILSSFDFISTVKETSSFEDLKNITAEVLGKLIYFRLAIFSKEASGHNMVTNSANYLANIILKEFPNLKYISISANYCTDKKVSAANGILGRGRKCIAEIIIPKKICQKFLRVEPEKLVELNIKKNLLGSILAGSLRSANAHYANILLAMYLATGQDAANIVEGSQGITFAEMQGEDLYFSITIPNIIVGTIGNGKNISFAKENLERLGCLKASNNGENSKRLATIICATTLCSELSLLAALSNQNELIDSHLKLEREV